MRGKLSEVWFNGCGLRGEVEEGKRSMFPRMGSSVSLGGAISCQVEEGQGESAPLRLPAGSELPHVQLIKRI